MKNLLYIFLLICISVGLKAQQLPFASPLGSLQHIWNPAFTAPGTDMELTGFYRKQWIGFNNAPNTFFASLEYPFVDMNMSAGAAIIMDKTGPVSKLGLQLNYAYKLKEVFGDDDQISLGINGFFYQYRFDPSNELINHPDDPLVLGMDQTKFSPSVGFGFAYMSNTRDFDSDNLFYFGLSYQQFLESELLLESGNAPRQKHLFANIGNKFFGYEYFLEPSVQVNYVSPEILDLILGIKYELEETFWAGLNYSSIDDLSIQGGVILQDVGGRYTSLRLGALAGFNVGPVFSAGPGFEFFVSYTIDKD